MPRSNWIDEYPSVAAGLAAGADVEAGESKVERPLNPSEAAYEISAVEEEVVEDLLLPPPAVEAGKPAVDISEQPGYQSGELPLRQAVSVVVPQGKKGNRIIWSVAVPTPLVMPVRASGYMDYGTEQPLLPGAGISFGVRDGKLRVVAPASYAGKTLHVFIESSKAPA